MRQESELYEHQRRVADYLYSHDMAMGVLRMGAGKTASALTAIGELIEDKVIRHALVIAPKRVALSVWPAEIRGWSHLAWLKHVVLDGGPERRRGLIAGVGDRQVTICGIDNVQWLCEILEKAPLDHPIFDCLVIDETSRLKDPKSKRGKALAKLAGRFKLRWGLTGTVRPNSSLDLFNPVKIITNGRLWGKSFYGWRQRRFYPLDWNQYQWAPLPGAEDQIRREFAQIAVTLNDGEMPDMPPLVVQVDNVDLPSDVRRTYRDMERKLLAELKPKEFVLAATEAVATGKLAQICNGFLYGETNADVTRLHEAKTEWLEETVESLNGESALLVYEYVEDLRVMRRLFGDIPYLGGGVSDRDAAAAIEGWNAGRVPLLALHPASGGHGLNLQHGGSRQIWMSPTWSPELWEQTLARTQRPGQAASHVMINVCVVRNSVDELKRLRVMGKMDAQAAFEQWLADRQMAAAA